MRLNLNETVKVKLTERGKEIYRQHFSPLPDGFEQPEPRIDEDGFTKIQLWVFMEMFGEHMSMLKQNVIEPLEIVFDTEEWLYNELEQIAEIIQLSPETPTNSEETSTNEVETPTISEKESVEGDLFNKSLWRMGMHDTNVRPCTMADTSTDTDLISRQAAINAVNTALFPKVNTAKDAENALESLPPVEPKPVCEDAISRADTLKAICAECDVNCEDCINKEAYCTEYAVIKSLSPVEPERPKGKWIVYPLIDDGRAELECPECGETFIQAIDYRPHFCENCGADMRGEK